MSQRHYSSGFLSVKNLRWSPCSFQPRHATIKRLITDLQTHHRFTDSSPISWQGRKAWIRLVGYRLTM